MLGLRWRAAAGATAAIASLVCGTSAGAAMFERAEAIGPTGNGLLRFPQAIAYDASGVRDPAPGAPPPPYVYVADQHSFLVQKFTADGAFVRQWGGYGSGPGRFGRESDVGTIGGIGGIATHVRGQVFVLDSFNNRIQQFAPGGTFLHQWGGAGATPGSFDTGLNGGLAVREPYVYVADQDNHRIQRFDLGADGAPVTDPSGRVVPSAVWGSLGTGDGQFDHPQGVAVNPNPDGTGDRSVYVADDNNDRVQKFGSAGAYQAQVGSTGTGEGQFRFPYDVGVDAPGHLYVADNNNHRVQQFDAGSLAFQRTWGAFGTDPGELGFPRSLAALAGDPAGGVFVGDTSSDRVQAFDSEGAHTGGWGTSGRVPGSFTHPAGVSVDGEGRIFVADTFNSRIQRLSAAGAAEATWGKLSSLGYPTTGSGNGEFRQPEGVAVDGARRLVYVADTDNHRVQALDADTGAWRATWGGTNAGTGAGQFRLPRAVALDAQGSVYVADTGNDRIQRFEPATGTWTVLPVAVSDPKGIAVDRAGKIYVADTANNRVLVLTPQGETVAAIAGGLLAPRGVAVDREGRVLVADAGNDRLVRFNPGDGGYVFDEAYGEAGSEPGQFAGLGALALDASGNAFTADRLNNRLQRLIASGDRTEPPPVAAAPPAPAAGAAPATRAARAPDGRRLILTARRRSRTTVRLSGALLPAAGGRLRSPCAGTVALAVRRSGRTIARRRARLRRACTYAALVRVRAGRRRTSARATLEGLRVTVAVPNRVRRR